MQESSGFRVLLLHYTFPYFTQSQSASSPQKPVIMTRAQINHSDIRISSYIQRDSHCTVQSSQ